MATPAWEWTKTRLTGLFSSQDPSGEEAESTRLASFVTELATTSERDVQNQLRGYLVARLGDDLDLMKDFSDLVQEICIKIDLEPPANWTSHVHASPGSVVVMGSRAGVSIRQEHPQQQRIIWAAMTTQEAARKLETLNRFQAVAELAGMDPASAARRLAHVDKTTAADMLSHMDEPLAADLLTRIAAPHTAELLALMEPPEGAAVLENMDPDWVVARLSDMEPDRALLLFSALGTKRNDDLLDAMERQQAVRLLRSVGKVMVNQNRIRTTFDMAEQEAKQIVSQAQTRAAEILDKAQRQADGLKVATERDMDQKPDDQAEPAVVDPQEVLTAKIYEILTARPDKLFSAREVASEAGVSLAAAKSVLSRLDSAGKIAHNRRAHIYSAI
jgi:DNA-binding transcriptional regulator YhcF (GntR family)